MKHFYLIFSFCLLSQAAELSFDQRYQALKKEKDNKAIEAFFEEVREKESNNPEYYIAKANYYFHKSERISISTKPAGANDFVLSNPKTGKPVGSIGQDGRDPKMMDIATSTLSEALQKFPERIDVWFGLSHLYQEGKQYDKQIETLTKMMDSVSKDFSKARWAKGSPLEDSPEKFFPSALEEIVGFYSDLDTKEGDEYLRKVAELSLKYFPNSVNALNGMSLYYSLTKDRPKAIEFLEKARQADPKDTIVLLNLGDQYKEMKQVEKAREAYKKVVELEKDSENAHVAEEKLKTLTDK